jgi:hypothetical protein
MRPGLRLAVALVIALGAPGRVQRDGRNSDCRWPAEASNHSADARRLSADAEFAEDLAIRYADTHFGRHNSTLEKGVERDRCLGKLFEEVAEEHGVPVEQVSSSLGRNRAYIDIAESLPFALLYGLAAVAIARMNWRRYSPDEHGWTIGITMASFLSLVLAAGKHNARRVMDLDSGGISDRQRTYELPQQSIVLGQAPIRAVCRRIHEFLAGSDQCGTSSTLGAFEWRLARRLRRVD